MKVIGLAGRPGSGKSAVARRLADRPGVKWIDLDRLAWEVYAPGTVAFERLVAAFGDGIVGPDGAIDRARLAKVVFSDPAARELLERIVHPEIGKRLSSLIEEHERRGTDLLIVEGALLTSSPYVDRSVYDILIWLEAPEGVRRRRLEAAGREDQIPRGEWIAPSDNAIVIDASGPVDQVAARVWERVVDP